MTDKSENAQKQIRCFRCGRPIETALSDVSPWETPYKAVYFESSGNYGSCHLDDNGTIGFVVCDECLKDNKEICTIKIRITGEKACGDDCDECLHKADGSSLYGDCEVETA